MKNIIFAVLIFIGSIFWVGCLRTYYPMYYYSSSLPIVNETNNNLDEGTWYLSLDHTYSETEYPDEYVQLIRGSYLYANTQNHSNYNLSIFGYGSTYKVLGVGGFTANNPKNFDGTKSGFGVGTDLKSSLNFKISKVKLGIGITGGLECEFGKYYDFRKSAKEANAIDSEHGLLFFSFSVFPLIVYEFSESIILSTQFNVGYPGLISPIIALNKDGNICWISFYTSPDNGLARAAIGFLIDINQITNPF